MLGRSEINRKRTWSKSTLTRQKSNNFNLVEAIWQHVYVVFKVSVKENEVPTEKNSSRASIFATKASYISN